MLRWQKDEKEIMLIWAKRADKPYCHEDYLMQPILIRMIRMIKINDDDVTTTVEIVMAIEEIEGVVEVVDMSIGK